MDEISFTEDMLVDLMVLSYQEGNNDVAKNLALEFEDSTAEKHIVLNL